MKNLFLSFILILFILPFQKGLAQNGFSIKDIMSSGFPEGLVCSSTEDLAAWVENREGVRNIFIYDGSRTRQLTEYKEDDGQVISSIIFSPDNSFLIFIRGGDPNRSGEIPNPLSLPERAKRQIWKIDLNGKNLKLISSGSSPVLSNKGNLLVFSDAGQIFKADLSSEDDPIPFFSTRGGAALFNWSPDDSKIAFMSARGDHSFIGIYDIDKAGISYISPEYS